MGTGPAGSVFGKFVLSRKPGYKIGGWGGGRQVEQRSSDLRVAYAEVKVQVRDLVRVVVIVDPLPQGCQFSGKIRFIEPQGVNGHRRPVPSAPSNCTPRESQTNFRGRTVWGL